MVSPLSSPIAQKALNSISTPHGLTAAPLTVHKMLNAVPTPSVMSAALGENNSLSFEPLSAEDEIRVCSYNVLAEKYGPNHLSNVPVAAADGSAHGAAPLNPQRLKGLKKKLGREIKRETIVCLQELSPWFADELTVFFEKKRYHLVNVEHSEGLGVGIAYARDRFQLTGNFLKAKRVADLKLRGTVQPPVSHADEQLWPNVCKRDNMIMSVRLAPIPKSGAPSYPPFCVTTYHMPCVPEDDRFMRIHGALAAQEAQTFARGNPYVLCGDFNSTPESPLYKMLTCGADADGSDDVPAPPGVHGSIRPEIDPLKSALKEMYGKEPRLTTFSFKKKDAEKGKKPFVACLDYIFVSSAWRVTDAVNIHENMLKRGTMPHEHEPSDHCLIHATLRRTTRGAIAFGGSGPLLTSGLTSRSSSEGAHKRRSRSSSVSSASSAGSHAASH
jgi:endonuclease/exonuclease/phosphatase family metal-dependent hydrolase